MTPRIVSVVVLLLVVCQLSSANLRHPSRRRLPPCCVKVTEANISNDVIGDTYHKPAAKHPCVEAIILQTEKGETCIDPRASWVKDLIANMTMKK